MLDGQVPKSECESVLRGIKLFLRHVFYPAGCSCMVWKSAAAAAGCQGALAALNPVDVSEQGFGIKPWGVSDNRAGLLAASC